MLFQNPATSLIPRIHIGGDTLNPPLLKQVLQHRGQRFRGEPSTVVGPAQHESYLTGSGGGQGGVDAYLAYSGAGGGEGEGEGFDGAAIRGWRGGTRCGLWLVVVVTECDHEIRDPVRGFTIQHLREPGFGLFYGFMGECRPGEEVRSSLTIPSVSWVC